MRVQENSRRRIISQLLRAFLKPSFELSIVRLLLNSIRHTTMDFYLFFGEGEKVFYERRIKHFLKTCFVEGQSPFLIYLVSASNEDKNNYQMTKNCLGCEKCDKIFSNALEGQRKFREICASNVKHCERIL